MPEKADAALWKIKKSANKDRIRVRYRGSITFTQALMRPGANRINTAVRTLERDRHGEHSALPVPEILVLVGAGGINARRS